MEIRTRSAVDVGRSASIWSEQEMILRPGVNYRVTSVEKVAKVAPKQGAMTHADLPYRERVNKAWESHLRNAKEQMRGARGNPTSAARRDAWADALEKHDMGRVFSRGTRQEIDDMLKSIADTNDEAENFIMAFRDEMKRMGARRFRAEGLGYELDYYRVVVEEIK